MWYVSLSVSSSTRAIATVPGITNTHIHFIISSNAYTHTHSKMKSVAAILTLLVGSSSAFAPVTTNSRSSSALAATAFGDRPGVIVPTGYFDPLNLATSEEKFEKFRAAELKHGRVAMLAVVGYVVPEFYRWGGEINFGLKFADIPNGIAAVSAVPALGWLQIITLIGAVESVSTLFSIVCSSGGQRAHSHFSNIPHFLLIVGTYFDPTMNTGFHLYQEGILQYDIGKPDLAPEAAVVRETQELQHGRLAMLATLELLRHDCQNSVVPGFDGLDNLITGLPFLYN